MRNFHYNLVSHLVGMVLIIASILVFNALSVQAQGDSPEPPPTPACFEFNFIEDAIVRISAGVHRDDLHCRILVRNRNYLAWFGTPYTNSGHIGNQDLLNDDIVQAIDVFSPTGVQQFEHAVVVCLRGRGQLIYAEGQSSPRAYFEPPVYTVEEWPGYICTTIFKPGPLVMVNRPAELPVPSDPVSNCTTTTRARLNLRAKPNTQSDVLTVIPFNTELQPDRVTSRGWYRYPNIEGLTQPGWLHSYYLNLEGDCGQVCVQSADGTRLQCPRP